MAPSERAYSQVERWYIYGTQHISKRTFDDPTFQSMVQAYYTIGGGQGKAPMLSATFGGLRKNVLSVRLIQGICHGG